jgi:hypothetical protein
MKRSNSPIVKEENKWKMIAATEKAYDNKKATTIKNNGTESSMYMYICVAATETINVGNTRQRTNYYVNVVVLPIKESCERKCKQRLCMEKEMPK